MTCRVLLVVLAFAVNAFCHAADAPRGRVSGGEHYALPAWFKASFLDIPEDLAEARKRNRQLVLFLHLDECPYCARLLDENFREGSNREFLERHFDVVGVNVRGANEVVWTDGRRLTERTLSQALKTFSTPTLVFLDPVGQVVLKLNGYRQPAAFRQALEFVAGGHYRNGTLAEYASRQPPDMPWNFRSHAAFSGPGGLSGYRGALAVVFEARNCADCAEWHDRVLNHPLVLAELKAFRVVRLDAESEAPLVDPAGRRTTARDWVRELGLNYRPGIVLFNEGLERARVDGMLYKFHMSELLRYTHGRHYAGGQGFRAYSATRREALLRQGVSIDYSR